MWASSSEPSSASWMASNVSAPLVKGQNPLHKSLSVEMVSACQVICRNKFTSFLSSLAVKEGFSRRCSSFAVIHADISGLCLIRIIGASAFRPTGQSTTDNIQTLRRMCMYK